MSETAIAPTTGKPLMYKGRPIRGGTQVPLDYDAPEGWQVIPIPAMHRGELWPMPPEGFDPDQSEKLVKAITKEWERLMAPTPGNPKPVEPVSLLINETARKLMPNPKTWGESCSIEITSDGRRLAQDGPKFKFIPRE